MLSRYFFGSILQNQEEESFFRTGLLLSFIFVISFPLTFLAVRYIPTIHPHVLFYFQEGYSEQRVHSWDERDSEKFVSFEQLLQSIFGKLQKTPYLFEQFIGKEQQVQWENEVKIAAAEYFVGDSVRYLSQNTEETAEVSGGEENEKETDPDHIPALTERGK